MVRAVGGAVVRVGGAVGMHVVTFTASRRATPAEVARAMESAEATRMMSTRMMSTEERRALRRARNDKRTRTWTRNDNKRVEAAWANREAQL